MEAKNSYQWPAIVAKDSKNNGRRSSHLARLASQSNVTRNVDVSATFSRKEGAVFTLALTSTASQFTRYQN